MDLNLTPKDMVTRCITREFVDAVWSTLAEATPDKKTATFQIDQSCDTLGMKISGSTEYLSSTTKLQLGYAAWDVFMTTRTYFDIAPDSPLSLTIDVVTRSVHLYHTALTPLVSVKDL